MMVANSILPKHFLSKPALAVPARPADRLVIDIDSQKVIKRAGQGCGTTSCALDYAPDPAGGAKRRYSPLIINPVWLSSAPRGCLKLSPSPPALRFRQDRRRGF